MTTGLFDIGDALHPTLAHPTPIDQVVALTRPERERRVEALVDQAHHIVDQAIRTYFTHHQHAATFAMVSGGNDSTVMLHLVRERIDSIGVANTGIGIEETWKPLPDAASSSSCDNADSPALRCIPSRSSGSKWTPSCRFGKPTRRVPMRRKHIPIHEARDADGIVWASPIANWHALDMNTYRLMNRDVPTNPVWQQVHMSGECLCGAYAKPGELDEIRYWRPDDPVLAEIARLERVARECGHKPPFDTWGHGQGKPVASREDYLCGKCADGLWEGAAHA